MHFPIAHTIMNLFEVPASVAMAEFVVSPGRFHKFTWNHATINSDIELALITVAKSYQYLRSSDILCISLITPRNFKISNPGEPSVQDNYLSILWYQINYTSKSALLALFEGNPPVAGEFPPQRPVTRSFALFFDLRLNKRLSKQSKRRWCETPSQNYDVTVMM